MKTKFLVLFILIMVLNISCSTTKYTHSQYMDMDVLNQTKFGIMNKFGRPTQQRIVGSTEEWTYDLSQKAENTKRSSNDVISSYDQAGNSVGSSVAGGYDKYIKITFRNGRVTKWETKGVDYTVKEKNTNAIVLILLTSVLVALLFSLISPPPTY